jgi:hypothetical protein
MPFLAPLIPAIAGGIASAAAGAGINALSKGAQSNPAANQVNLDSAQLNGAEQGQSNLSGQLAQAGGVGNESSVYNQQQALANQLGAMAQGQGPTPALNQLNQSTGANVNQQAALMAGQRGAGANAGLMARQAAQQGANTQQQAVGQAATLQAQQQLGSIGALQAQQSNMASLAGTQVGQQQNAVNSQAQTALQQQQQMLSQQQAINSIQAEQGQQQAKQIGQIGGGIASGIGSAVTGALGGTKVANYMSGVGTSYAEGGEIPSQTGYDAIKKENYKGKSKLGQLMYASGGKVTDMKVGGHVPGKAKVGGAKDSYSNDTVPAILSPGEIVLPRSVTQSANPAEAAHKFVKAVKAKKKGK